MTDQVLIVASRFNDLVTRPLVAAAQDVITRNGTYTHETIWVPGAFEVPLAAQKGAQSGRFKAIICLGAVIRGETPHFDYVAGQSAAGIMKAGLDTGTPIINGILTTNTVDEALNRSGLKLGNKGAEAAQTALEMIGIIAELESPHDSKR